MRTFGRVITHALLVVLLTVLTQVGGIVWLVSLVVSRLIRRKVKFKTLLVFLLLYGITTFLLVPMIAPSFGRERIVNTAQVQPANYLTTVLNRNYVHPALNEVLRTTSTDLDGSGLTINYLDANFPFFNGFPLLPHLSHNDGKKLDLSLVFAEPDGTFSSRQQSLLGYGSFVGPNPGERDQITHCLNAGHRQYDFTKYLSPVGINQDLTFSEKGTRLLIQSVLRNKAVGKIFIEPHLKQRLRLTSSKVRFHGCQAVRHDDHIHVQLW